MRDIPLEFAEYLASAAEEYIDAVNEVAMKQSIIDGAIGYDARLPLSLAQLEQARDEETDALRKLESTIYEFRKRAREYAERNVSR